MESADTGIPRARDTTGSYPEPNVPVRPVLSFSSFFGADDSPVPSVEEAGRCIWVTSGRIASALGLQGEGIGEGDEVLMPAYYCSTMFDAIEAVGAKPVFYKSRADLSMDLEDVSGKISGKTKALIAVHFFGFPQSMNEIRKVCHDADLVLVEDCAHAYFGSYAGKPLGSFGDFAITSAMKFFPISDGGMLVLPPGKDLPVPLHSGGAGFELKAVINNVERSIRYGRFQPFTLLLRVPLILKDWVWSAMKRVSKLSVRERSDSGEDAPGRTLGPDSSYGGFGFDVAWMHVRMSWISRWLVGNLPRARMVDNRRRNFERLLGALSGLDNAWPLYPDLPEGVVPYAFPLLITNVDVVFPALKRAGVPILRWEDLDESVCDVSTRYSKELLQLPCHHEISAKELDWMIDRITAILSEHV